MIITIDGPAGTGKTTAAMLLAEKLGIIYFDTGALYRALTWFYFQNRDRVEKPALELALKQFDLKIEMDPTSKTFNYSIEGTDITTLIREIRVTEKVSEIAAIDIVRSTLIPIQRNFAKSNSVVVEGRDTGSVVFPSADWKFFLTASLKVRAQRRFLEYQQKNIECDLSQVEQSIAKRDHTDSNRAVAPLTCPEKAHVIETDDKTADEVVEAMLTIVGD